MCKEIDWEEVLSRGGEELGKLLKEAMAKSYQVTVLQISGTQLDTIAKCPICGGKLKQDYDGSFRSGSYCLSCGTKNVYNVRRPGERIKRVKPVVEGKV